MTPPPATVDADQLVRVLRESGYGALNPLGFAGLLHTTPAALETLRPYWDDLPLDNYLRDGGRYRRRRHSCFVVQGQTLRRVKHRAHWQSIDYNALHGGLERWFEPMVANMLSLPVWPQLLCALGTCFSAVNGARRWYVEAHQFRIDTTDGIGRPTPEGAHRDGVDFVVVALVDRSGIKGGETRVFDITGPHGVRFTMSEPWSALLLDDKRVTHESTPIQPIDSTDQENAHRDTLVLTFRANGFQGATS